MRSRISAVFVGGIIATAVMTIFMLLAPAMGMPKMPIGNMLANFMGIPVVLGWIMHFIIGIVLAGGYVYWAASFLPGSAWLRGAIYSLIPFLMAQIIVVPMMGGGVFSSNTPSPFLMVMGSLVVHLVYGAVLGLVAKTPEV